MHRVKKLLSKNSDDAMLTLILVVCIGLVTLGQPGFFSLGTLKSVAYQIPEMGLLTAAMAVTMLVGGINLSVIASANLSGIVMALIMTRYIPQGTDNLTIVLLAVLAGVLVSVAAGAVNGLIIANFKIPDMLATLGTQLLFSGICLAITRGATIAGYPDSFKFIGNKTLAGVPFAVYIFVLALIFLAVLLKRTPFGPRIYLYGSNKLATVFSGVNEKALIVKTYTLSGLFVGLAAVILTSRFNAAAQGYAASYLMQTILIAVLGGVSPNGGHGKVSGLILGVLIFQVVGSGLNILRLNAHLTTAIYGLILLLAVTARMLRTAK